MRGFGTRHKAKDWARLAMTFGLLVTDAKLWSAMNDQIHQQAADISDDMRRNHGPNIEQLSFAQRRQGSDWLGRITSLFAGVGIGIGVGMLIAPSSGEEARATLRAKVSDVKNSVGDMAARTSRSRAANEVRSTGTVGD
jgi:hypothetical protein